MITVSSLDGKRPGVGEIVAFLRPGSGNLVVHRVVARHGSNLLIQGDSAHGHPDGLIPPGNLLGRVTRIERNGDPVWLGLGPERYLIAWLSRVGVLVPMGRWLAVQWRRVFRKH